MTSARLDLAADACSCGGHGDVIETRAAPGGVVRRRRKCLVCGVRWTTHEQRAEARAGSTIPVSRARIVDLLQRIGDLAGVFGDILKEPDPPPAEPRSDA